MYICALMHSGRTILDDRRFDLTMTRLCHQLVENHGAFHESCMVGIQSRGVLLANKLYKTLQAVSGSSDLEYGKLDITFYRDDFRHREKPLKASSTEMEFLIEGKKVILVDDVLYTGRTVQAAMTALRDYGRPASVELLVLIDRRFNRHLPIRANYVGMQVDAVDEAYVKVDWNFDDSGQNRVLIYSAKQEND